MADDRSSKKTPGSGARQTLQGSCHCRAVRFSVTSAHVYPFNLCYCSICRKTAGGGGFAINLSADAATLRVKGQAALHVYQARIEDPDGGRARKSPARRSFCSRCGSALWLWDPRWPELLHPFASAIDSPLPQPPQRTHLMLDSKAAWVDTHAGPRDLRFPEYPEESIAEWHERHGFARPEDRPNEADAKPPPTGTSAARKRAGSAKKKKRSPERVRSARKATRS